MVGPAKDLDFPLQLKDAVLQHFNVKFVFSLSSYFYSSVDNKLLSFTFADLLVRRWTLTEVIPFYIPRIKVFRLLHLRILNFTLGLLLLFLLQRSEKRSQKLILIDKLYFKHVLHFLYNILFYKLKQPSFVFPFSSFNLPSKGLN